MFKKHIAIKICALLYDDRVQLNKYILINTGRKNEI